MTRRPRFRHKAEYDFCERKKGKGVCGGAATQQPGLSNSEKSLLLLPKPRAYGARGMELNRCPLPLAHPIPLKPEMEPGIRIAPADGQGRATNRRGQNPTHG